MTWVAWILAVMGWATATFWFLAYRGLASKVTKLWEIADRYRRLYELERERGQPTAVFEPPETETTGWPHPSRMN